MECDKFFLEFVNDEAGVLYQIDEPNGWAEMTLNLATDDRKMFARNSSFSNGEFPLKFLSSYSTIKYGHYFDRILSYNNIYGHGACINTHVEQCGDIIALATLNFSTMKTDNCNFFEVMLKEYQPVDTLKDSLDVDADINGVTTLNGEPCIMPNETVCLKSKIFQEEASQGVQDFDDPNGTYEDYSFGISPSTLGFLGNYGLQFANLDQGADGSIENNLPFIQTHYDTIPSDDYIYTFAEDGFVDFETYFNDIVTLDVGTLQTNYISSIVLDLVFEHKRFDDTIVTTTILHTHDFDINDTGNAVNLTATPNPITINNIPVEQGDKFFLYWNFSGGSAFAPSGSFINVEFQQNVAETYNSIVYRSEAPDSVHRIPRLLEVFKKQVAYLTDNTVTVEAPCFEENGEYHDYFLPNGYMVRNANLIENRQYSYSPQDFMDSTNAIFAVGFQFYEDKVFIGKATEFYKNEHCGLIDFPIIFYNEEYSKDFFLKSFEFAYKHIPKDFINTIDEFNTKAKYSLPTNKIKGKCKVESDFNASSYSIERQRRKQFSNTRTVSTEFDDIPFIIDTVKDDDTGKIMNRTDEDVAVTNSTLISPETTYNVRISPLRNFARWFPYIGSALHYEVLGNNVVSTYHEGNEFLESLIAPPYSSTLNTTVIEKDSFPIGIFNEHIFDPKELDIEFVGVPLKTVLALKEDLIKKRGFHTIKNLKGETIKVFILEYEYQICKGQLNIIAMKANPNYATVN